MLPFLLTPTCVSYVHAAFGRCMNVSSTAHTLPANKELVFLQKRGIAPEFPPQYEEVKSTQKYFGFVAIGFLKILFNQGLQWGEQCEHVSGRFLSADGYIYDWGTWLGVCMAFSMFVNEIFTWLCCRAQNQPWLFPIWRRRRIGNCLFFPERFHG